VLARSGQSENDTNWKAVSRLVLTECERVKEALSFREEAELSVLNPLSGDLISAEFTRTQFEDLLDKHEAFAKIDKTIRRALSSANEKGFGDEDIKAVLMWLQSNSCRTENTEANIRK
jgi:molecular chaperone DnaK